MSLVQTKMQSLRTQYPNSFDRNELRFSELGGWNFFTQESNAPYSIFTPDIKAKIDQSFGNSVVIPVLNSEVVTIGNVRSCTIADSENTSALVTLTFATFAFGFTITPSQHFNNDVSEQADFDRKMMKYVNQLGRDLDTLCIAVLENNKNSVSAAPSKYYTFSGGAVQVSQAQKNDYYNNLDSIIKEMDFNGGINIITSRTGMPLVSRLMAQGGSNSTNEQFQFNGQKWFPTNRIANSGGIQSTHYAVQDGSVAYRTRLDPDALAGRSIGDPANPIKQWGRTVLPNVGIEAGTFYTADCSDRSILNSSVSGLNRALLQGYEFSFDLCVAVAYNSNTAAQYQPILKTQVSTS